MICLFAYLLSVFISYWLFRLAVWLDNGFRGIPVLIIISIIPGMNICAGLLFVMIAFSAGEMGEKIAEFLHL